MMIRTTDFVNLAEEFCSNAKSGVSKIIKISACNVVISKRLNMSNEAQ